MRLCTGVGELGGKCWIRSEGEGLRKGLGLGCGFCGGAEDCGDEAWRDG